MALKLIDTIQTRATEGGGKPVDYPITELATLIVDPAIAAEVTRSDGLLATEKARIKALEDRRLVLKEIEMTSTDTPAEALSYLTTATDTLLVITLAVDTITGDIALLTTAPIGTIYTIRNEGAASVKIAQEGGTINGVAGATVSPKTTIRLIKAKANTWYSI